MYGKNDAHYRALHYRTMHAIQAAKCITKSYWLQAR